MRIAVVGAGRWGAVHCEKVKRHSIAELVGVVDCEGSKADELAHRYGTSSFRCLGDCADADAVIIASSIHSLPTLASEAMALGIPFLVEKPVSIKTGILKGLMERGGALGSNGLVGYQLRYHPKLRGIMHDKCYRFVRREDHFSTVEALLEDCGVHELDLAHYLLGPKLEFSVIHKDAGALSVRVVAESGRSMDFVWRIGRSRLRELSSDSGLIDFTRNDYDLLTMQLDHFVSSAEGGKVCGARISDAYAVAEAYESIREQVGFG